MAAHQCGLITKSDAERLTSYLMIQNNQVGGEEKATGAKARLTATVHDQFQSRAEDAGASEDDAAAHSSPPPLTAATTKTLKEDTPPATAAAAASLTADFRDRPSATSVTLKVKHECFGLAKGTMTADDYAAPNSKCIKCSECGESGKYPPSWTPCLCIRPSRRQRILRI